jgi:sugar phosphate isomerase/epimerase
VYESCTYIQLSEHSAQAYTTPAAAARALTSMSLLRPIAARHGITDGRRLERMVRAEPVRDARMVYLRIRDKDPERLRALTVDVVNAFMQAASDKVTQRRRLAERRYQVLAD